MKNRIENLLKNSPLAVKIRLSYFLIAIPMLAMILVSFYNMWTVNSRYDNMISAAGTASEFSLDFKKDFDYETYLLIVENKKLSESELDNLMNEAERILSGLETLGARNTRNDSRLKSVRKYLRNLETYKTRIEENLTVGNRYEENIEIWENDVQIVTALLRESMLQYIYYEIQDMQTTRSDYIKTYRHLAIGMIIAFVLLTIGITVLSYYIPHSITKPLTQLSEVTNKIAGGDLTVRAETEYGAEIGALSSSFNTMIDKVNELLEQVTTEQVRLRRAELELLQAQINPHFLYNTLDTIVWLAEAGDSRQVVSMVKSLSDFFRTALNRGKDMVTIREELQHVNSYLKIQQVRYQDILDYSIDVPDSLNEYMIPKITIQPIVENALYHGIKNKRGMGFIAVTGSAEEDCFVITVTDDGIGIEAGEVERLNRIIKTKSSGAEGAYGLINVNERLRLKFGENYGITIESEPGVSTAVHVRLPY